MGEASVIFRIAGELADLRVVNAGEVNAFRSDGHPALQIMPEVMVEGEVARQKEEIVGTSEKTTSEELKRAVGRMEGLLVDRFEIDVNGVAWPIGGGEIFESSLAQMSGPGEGDEHRLDGESFAVVRAGAAASLSYFDSVGAPVP